MAAEGGFQAEGGLSRLDEAHLADHMIGEANRPTVVDAGVDQGGEVLAGNQVFEGHGRAQVGHAEVFQPAQVNEIADDPGEVDVVGLDFEVERNHAWASSAIQVTATAGGDSGFAAGSG
ncbi:hypothetical protein D3C86_1560340 [compost metagenome]